MWELKVKNGFGVRYKVMGHDQVLTASTCDGTASTFDTQISVYEGGCGKLECVASNDQYSPFVATGLRFLDSRRLGPNTFFSRTASDHL